MRTSALLDKKPTLSIIIVTHNNDELIFKLLASVKEAIKFFASKSEVIIIDNASIDKTCKIIKEKFPEVILIENPKNQGYAVANNQGLKKAKGEYRLLLNSDTILTKDVLKKMISYLKVNPEVGVVTCKVLLPDGKIDPACHRGFPTPWAAITYFSGLEKIFPEIALFSQYHLWYKALNNIHEIDSPSGAFFLTREAVIKTVGLLDESFFMYGEDLDWSFRIKKAGWKIVYNPTSSMIHLKKQSGLNGKDRATRERTLIAFYEAMKIFYKNHYKAKYPKLVTLLIFLIIDLKKTVSLTKLKILWT